MSNEKIINAPPRDARGIQQDLIGVFAACYNLKAGSVEIYQPGYTEEQQDLFPTAGSVYRDERDGSVFKVHEAFAQWTACEDLASGRIFLLPEGLFLGDGKDAPVITRLDPEEAEDLINRIYSEVAADHRVWDELDQWEFKDKYPHLSQLQPEHDMYLQLSEQMQDLNAEIIISIPGEQFRLEQTWLPQIVNKEDRAQLLVSAQFMTLLEKGYVLLVSPVYAETVLSLNEAKRETARVLQVSEARRNAYRR